MGSHFRLINTDIDVNGIPYSLTFLCTRWFIYDRDWFFLNHNCQTLTCTFQSSTYSPQESTHFFPTFWKHPDALFTKGLWLAAYPLPNSLDDGVVVRRPCGSISTLSLCPLWSTHTTQTHGSVRDTLPHTVVGVCGEFQRTGLRHPDCSGVDTPPTTSLF